MKRSPLPLLVLGGGALVLVFSTSAPEVIIATLAGVVSLLLLARHRASPIYLIAGTLSGLGLVLLTPFVGSDSGTVLLRGPQLAVIDTEITLQELGAGAVDGIRLLSVALLFGAMLANLDMDRLHAAVGRVAPRSALIVALTVRLLPRLERDGVMLAEGARARGVALSDGSWISRARRAAPLTTPLVGSALERGVDIAEAMEARGYAGGALSDLPFAVNRDGDGIVLAAGITLILVGVAVLVGASALGVAVGGFAALLIAAFAVRR